MEVICLETQTNKCQSKSFLIASQSYSSHYFSLIITKLDGKERHCRFQLRDEFHFSEVYRSINYIGLRAK